MDQDRSVTPSIKLNFIILEFKLTAMPKPYYILLFILLISCKQKTVQQDDVIELGEISIEVTAKEEAKGAFTDGLLLMHSFEFKDAAAKFKQAQEIDPDFAMAYWGEAMTHNHPLWREQDKEDALEILSRLGASPEEQRTKFTTEFEKDLCDAVHILYGEGSKKERDIAYSEFMGQLHKKYPKNQEVAAFYSLSLLGAVKGGRDYEMYAKGAKIAQSIIDENPNHPGALHYLIHSYDDPENAPKALDAATRYSKVAPDAAHALHMPSHIYVALGMWDEVISSNIASWNASLKRKEAKELDNDALNYHAFKWQMYGHLQKGEFKKAKELVKDMQSYCYVLPSAKAVAHLVMMKGAYFNETNAWDDPLFQDTVDYTQLAIQIRAARTYTLARHAFANGNSKKIEELIEDLTMGIGLATNEALTGTDNMCSGGSYGKGRATHLHVNRAEVMKLEMQALHAMLTKDEEAAENFLKTAVILEENTSYMYGPPEIVKPSHELYADWLMEKARYKEAEKFYKKVLNRAPKRLLVMQGLEKINQLSS